MSNRKYGVLPVFGWRQVVLFHRLATYVVEKGKPLASLAN